MVNKDFRNSELETAAQCFISEGSDEAKVAVINAAEALVNYYAGIYSSGIIDEDLRQAAYEGILKALDRYDPDRGTLFCTFAVHYITGEIRHELRRREFFKVPDWIKTIQASVISATEELAQQNSAMPSLGDIARKVNISEDGVLEAMQAGHLPLDDIDLARVKHIRYENFRLPIEDVITVRMSLERMDDLQRNVLTLIFYDGMTQEETAKKLGINQRQVSRIMNRSLKEMHSYVMA